MTKQSVNEQSGPVLSCHELVNQSVSWLLDYFYLLRYYLELRKRCIPNLLLMCVFFKGELRELMNSLREGFPQGRGAGGWVVGDCVVAVIKKKYVPGCNKFLQK